MNSDELFMLKENLEILADERDPKTGYPIEDTVLKSSFNKQILKDAATIIDRLLKLDFNPSNIDKRKKYNFYISKEDRRKIVITKEPIPISAFVYHINECIDDKKMKKLKATQITSWLMKEGYLSEIKAEDGRFFKVLTKKSKNIGISSEKRKSKYGRVYGVNLYNEESQKFIIEHLDDIVTTEIIIT
jgi:hypothetical protein